MEDDKSETDVLIDVVHIIHKGTHNVTNVTKTDASASNSGVQATDLDTGSGKNSTSFLSLLDIITKLCNQENVQTLVDSGLVGECINAIEVSLHPTPYVIHCIKVLAAVIPLHRNTCGDLISKRKQVIFKLSSMFDWCHEDKDKKGILTLFNAIIKNGLPMDDYVFDVMFYKTCTVLDTDNNDLLLQCLICMDNYIEIYQEWDVNKKLQSLGIVPKKISKLCNSNDEILCKTLRCLGNLLSAEDLTVNQCVISGGVLNHLSFLLFHDNKDVVIATLWAISNVAAGPEGSTDYIFEFNIISVITEYVICLDNKIAFESMWVLANLFEDASPKQRRLLLINKPILKCYVECLSGPKEQLQQDASEGVIYLELLRNTFKSIIQCVSSPKETSNLSSEHEDNDNTDDEKDKNIFQCLTNSEKNDVIGYMKEMDLHGRLKTIANNPMPNVKDEKDIERRQVFKELTSNFHKILDDYRINELKESCTSDVLDLSVSMQT